MPGLQVVASRAIAIPSCFMLMPVIDMLNHRGNETAFLYGDASSAMDNVRHVPSGCLSITRLECLEKNRRFEQLHAVQVGLGGA